MMSPDKIIRAWKDKRYRDSLTDEERAQLPENPSGVVELSDGMLRQLGGATGLYCTEYNPFTLGRCCAEPSGGNTDLGCTTTASGGTCDSGAGTSFCGC